MKYYELPTAVNNVIDIHGYDETDPTQQFLIDAAIAAKYKDVTATWPPTPTINLPGLAQVELSIVTGPTGQIIRCAIVNIKVPAAWQTYVLKLRNIINGTDVTSTVLPVAPSYVAGT